MVPMFWEWKYIEYVLNIFYGKQQTCRVPLIKGNDTLRNFTFAPIAKAAYRMAPKELEEMKKQLDELLHKG